VRKGNPTRALLVVHGGAGTISRDQMTPEKETAYRAGLSDALLAGYKVLSGGGTSLDAVEAAVCVLEDNPLFNAGRGAVFTSDGHNELDASIMDGKTHMAGAVASVRGIKNPVKAARAVMEKTSHVMLVGKGAESARAGLKKTARTSPRRGAGKNCRKRRKKAREIAELSARTWERGRGGRRSRRKSATATSTGGLTNKRWGRVGDSIIGAGTYADNATCAVSCRSWRSVHRRIGRARNVGADEVPQLTVQAPPGTWWTSSPHWAARTPVVWCDGSPGTLPWK
jgi:beta-aspartyl-peptidase (threonine type)